MLDRLVDRDGRPVEFERAALDTVGLEKVERQGHRLMCGALDRVDHLGGRTRFAHLVTQQVREAHDDAERVLDVVRQHANQLAAHLFHLLRLGDVAGPGDDCGSSVQVERRSGHGTDADLAVRDAKAGIEVAQRLGVAHRAHECSQLVAIRPQSETSGRASDRLLAGEAGEPAPGLVHLDVNAAFEIVQRDWIRRRLDHPAKRLFGQHERGGRLRLHKREKAPRTIPRSCVRSFRGSSQKFRSPAD